MRLGLLMHRRYPPYSKWLGTAFAWLPGAAGLGASLAAAASARDWHTREQHMCRAYEAVAAWHNELGFTPPLDTRVRGFYERPYRVIGAGRFAAALREVITDPRLRHLPLTGAVGQFTDSTETGSFASNRIAPWAVTVVEPIITQGAVRAAAKAALQTGDDGPAGPVGGSRHRARLRRDGMLLGAATDSDADQQPGGAVPEFGCSGPAGSVHAQPGDAGAVRLHLLRLAGLAARREHRHHVGHGGEVQCLVPGQ